MISVVEHSAEYEHGQKLTLLYKNRLSEKKSSFGREKATSQKIWLAHKTSYFQDVVKGMVPYVAHVFPVLHNAIRDRISNFQLLPVFGSCSSHNYVLSNRTQNKFYVVTRTASYTLVKESDGVSGAECHSRLNKKLPETTRTRSSHRIKSTNANQQIHHREMNIIKIDYELAPSEQSP